MKVVLDTNILVSGLIKPASNCGRIIDLVLSGEVTLIFDSRILYEYNEVLNRKKFKIRKDEINALIDFIESSGEPIIPQTQNINLGDNSDIPFAECTLNEKGIILITGNKKHFTSLKDIKLFSPDEFLKFIGKKQN